MKLPFDYSRCLREECPLSRKCARFMDPGRPKYQTFTDYPGGEGYYGFIDVTEGDE